MRNDVPYHRDAHQARQPAFRHDVDGDRSDDDGYEYDYGCGVRHGGNWVRAGETTVIGGNCVESLLVDVICEVVRGSLVGGVSVARVVLGVACGDAGVNISFVGGSVGVEVVGRSSVGSRSCRLWVLASGAWRKRLGRWRELAV